METVSRPSDAVIHLIHACRHATLAMQALAMIPLPEDQLEQEALLKVKQQIRFAFRAMANADRTMNGLVEKGEARIKAGA
jgi:hypothetical protein